MKKISDTNIVKIDFDTDMYWNIIVKKTDKIEYGNDPVIELSWGWTAEDTEEEIKNLPDDCPRGHKSVKILLSQAIDLRNKLNELIEE